MGILKVENGHIIQNQSNLAKKKRKSVNNIFFWYYL